jgi:hypothetical protein
MKFPPIFTGESEGKKKNAILANISREESYCIRTSAKKGTILEDTNGGFSILPPSAAEFS